MSDIRRAQLVLALRRSGVRDPAVLEAMERIPRELFVPESLADRAYDDIALPLAEGQTVSQPHIVALMCEALELSRQHTVLEVGTGSGYQAAVLARLARRVYTIERHRPLLAEAEGRLCALKLHNVTTRVGDGRKGWPEAAPFARIVVAAAAAEPPPALLEQLASDGVLVLPIGQAHGAQELVRIRKSGGSVQSERLMPVRFVPLVAEKSKASVFSP